MTDTHEIALWRTGSTRAKSLHIWRYQAVNFLRRLLNPFRDPRQSLPRLTDRQARDIGLDPADLEFSRLQLPSLNARHPML